MRLMFLLITRCTLLKLIVKSSALVFVSAGRNAADKPLVAQFSIVLSAHLSWMA